MNDMTYEYDDMKGFHDGITRKVHGDMDFHFCHGSVSKCFFSVNLTYLVTKNHSISSTGQKLKKPQAYFRRRCKLHLRVTFLRSRKLVS